MIKLKIHSLILWKTFPSMPKRLWNWSHQLIRKVPVLIRIPGGDYRGVVRLGADLGIWLSGRDRKLISDTIQLSPKDDIRLQLSLKSLALIRLDVSHSGPSQKHPCEEILNVRGERKAVLCRLSYLSRVTVNINCQHSSCYQPTVPVFCTVFRPT